MSPPSHTDDIVVSSPVLPTDISNDVAIQDWDILFDAIVERLSSAFEDLHSRTAPPRRQSWAQARVSVMDCVQALDQLHLTATHEFAQHQQTVVAGDHPSMLGQGGALAVEDFPKIRGEVVRAIWQAWYDNRYTRVGRPPSAQHHLKEGNTGLA